MHRIVLIVKKRKKIRNIYPELSRFIYFSFFFFSFNEIIKSSVNFIPRTKTKLQPMEHFSIRTSYISSVPINKVYAFIKTKKEKRDPITRAWFNFRWTTATDRGKENSRENLSRGKKVGWSRKWREGGWVRWSHNRSNKNFSLLSRLYIHAPS